MDDKGAVLERRLEGMKNVYEKINALIDSLPDGIPVKYKNLLKDKILGDDELKEFIKEIENRRPPRFLLVGRTGVGKSSMINAICGTYAAKVNDIESCTNGIQKYNCLDQGRVLMEILDSRGIQESSGNEDAERQLLEEAKKFSPDVAILMLSCNHRDSIDDDIEYMKHLVAEYEKINGKDTLPVIVVINKADTMAPPDQLIPEHYSAGKLKRIQGFEDNVRQFVKQFELKAVDVITISSYIQWGRTDGTCVDTDDLNDVLTPQEIAELVVLKDGRYHIQELRSLLESAIPDVSARQGMRMAYRLNVVISNLCNSIIGIFAKIAGIIALTPLPIADVGLLIALQATMIVVISAISGREVTIQAAIEFIVSLGGVGGIGFALRLGVQQAAKLLNAIWPVAGSAISAAVAWGGTYGMGKAAQAYYVGNVSMKEAQALYRDAQKNVVKNVGRIDDNFMLDDSVKEKISKSINEAFETT